MLLSCCDIVISFSEFPEGWNRVAHEALLTKTPVIGSGQGGMNELLNKSGQIICRDIAIRIILIGQLERIFGRELSISA